MVKYERKITITLESIMEIETMLITLQGYKNSEGWDSLGEINKNIVNKIIKILRNEA